MFLPLAYRRNPVDEGLPEIVRNGLQLIADKNTPGARKTLGGSFTP
jgi:hypothetical protein